MSYLPAGQDEETPRSDELLVIAQERLEIDKERLRMAKRSTFFDGVKTVVTIAIPVAAFLGLQKYFQIREEEAK
jgi:hypothetical protein